MLNEWLRNLQSYWKMVTRETQDDHTHESPIRIACFTLGATIRDIVKPLVHAMAFCSILVICICAGFAGFYYAIVEKQHDLIVPAYMDYLKDSILIFFNLPIFTSENNPLFADAFSKSPELVPTLSNVMMAEKIIGLLASAVILAVITDSILHPVNVLWILPKAVIIPGYKSDGSPSLRLVTRYWIRTPVGVYLNRTTTSLYFRERNARLAHDSHRYPKYYQKRDYTMVRGIRTEEIELFEENGDSQNGWLLLELLSNSFVAWYQDRLDELSEVFVWDSQKGCAVNWRTVSSEYNNHSSKLNLYSDYKLDLLIAGTMPDGDNLQLRTQYGKGDILPGYDFCSTIVDGKRTYTNILRLIRPSQTTNRHLDADEVFVADEVEVSNEDLSEFFTAIKKYSEWLSESES